MNKHRLMVKLIFFTLTALSVSFSNAQDSTHIEMHLGWMSRPLTDLEMDHRVLEAAEMYKDYAPVPRVAFFDVAYPSSRKECDSLRGNAILLVTAVVQDSSELPLESIYLDGPDTMTVLSQIITSFSLVDNSDSVVASTFGYFREDIFLFLPMREWFGGARLLVDFRGDRQGFQLISREKGVPSDLQNLLPFEVVDAQPDTAAVMELIAREFPGLSR